MTERKKAAAAGKAATKAEPERPYELVEGPGPGEPRRLTSAELEDKTRLEEPVVRPPVRGPMTGEPGMSDADYVSAFATPEELRALRSSVAARRAKSPDPAVYMRCDDPRCGRVIRLPAGQPDGGICVMCNWKRREDGGHLRRMTDAEVNEHLFEEAKREKAQAERDLNGALYRANQRRGQAGLAPFTLEEFKQLRGKERLEQIGRDRELGRVAALCRRKP